jgi:xylulokinase
MVLVFDIGTTTVKAAVFSHDGDLVEKASQPISLKSSGNPNMHEADPKEWIHAIGELSMRFSAGMNREIQAIVVSGNGPTLILTDADGTVIYPAMTWMDRRGIEESRIVNEKCGIFVDPSFFLPKALWIKRNEPEIYDRTEFFFTCPEYAAFYLTGEAVTVFPGEGLENFMWTDEIVRSLDLDPRKFPPFVDFGHPVGAVNSTAARELGVRKGVPVFAGGPDFIMSILGTAAVVPGRACDRAGTSEGINICSNLPIEDSRLMCYRHIAKDYWNITGIISTSGKAFDWFRGLEMGDELSAAEMDKLAATSRPGSGKLLFLPYLSGERAPIWDPHARGVFAGLTLNHEKKDLARAVLESTGFAIRDVLTVMEENKVSADELRIAGNPAKSDIWNQIKADITGKNILVPSAYDSELVGDLCVALKGLGEYKSLPEAALQLVRIKKSFTPDLGSKALYDDLFGIYREIYQKLKPVFSDLSGIPDKENE